MKYKYIAESIYETIMKALIWIFVLPPGDCCIHLFSFSDGQGDSQDLDSPSKTRLILLQVGSIYLQKCERWGLMADFVITTKIFVFLGEFTQYGSSSELDSELWYYWSSFLDSEMKTFFGRGFEISMKD